MKIYATHRGTFNDIFASTGGRAFDPKGDVVLFIHGSGQNHLGYMLQHRFLANRGYQCITPDFPGHGLTGGEPLTSIEEMAHWLATFMDATGIEAAHIVGHSQGGLVALEFASIYPHRTRSATFAATGLAIPVNDYLLGLAKDKEPKAIRAMMDWGHGPTGHIHDHTMPGASHMVYGSQLMASNAPGALYADLSACNAYTNGPNAADQITCPTLCILSGQDKMTPLKAGRKLHAALGGDLAVIDQAGHMNITEQPWDVTRALRTFLNAQQFSAAS
ncbi:MAG: alpha/beta hydrolase [Pseudomonadota bacterium]